MKQPEIRDLCIQILRAVDAYEFPESDEEQGLRPLDALDRDYERLASKVAALPNAKPVVADAFFYDFNPIIAAISQLQGFLMQEQCPEPEDRVWARLCAKFLIHEAPDIFSRWGKPLS